MSRKSFALFCTILFSVQFADVRHVVCSAQRIRLFNSGRSGGKIAAASVGGTAVG